MNKYWLVVTTRKNFDASASRNFNVEGFKDNCLKRVKRIEKGDSFACYIKSEKVFGATYTAESEYKPSNSDKALQGLIWADEKEQKRIIYPLRFRTKKVLVLTDNRMLPAQGVNKYLQFVKNKEKWGHFYHHSLREISEEDFEVIESEMRKRVFNVIGKE
ncbi:MAG: EVE domain-containing protein [Dehalococcoidales bacterium]|nr:EVE domain-containing protein [Dehalococcoidales bacterium]